MTTCYKVLVHRWVYYGISFTGLMPLHGVPILYGDNIGSCTTSLLSV